MLFHGRWKEGRARLEGSEVDMGLLLISTGGRAETSEGSGDKATFHFISGIF